MKFLIYIYLLSFSVLAFGQNVQVDSQTYTPQQLIEDILIGSNCISNVVVTNVVGGNFNGIDQSYGYFDANGSTFPFQSGIVLTTGRLAHVPGPNTSLSDDDAPNWYGDSDLEYILNENNTLNATIIEFEFTTIASQISFRYLFASEEYQYNNSNTCVYSDLFGFLIRNVNDTQYENIALIPNTQTPVKVTTVHPDIPNGCPAQNETYFGSWNNSSAPINFNGQTTILTATANTIPNETYHVKLVIADEQNYRYDSAVFLEAGSFNLGIDLGTDLTFITNNPVCGDTHTLDAGTYLGAMYQWFFNGNPISGATSQTYTVESSNISGGLGNGTYGVEVTISSSCQSTGEIQIDFADIPTNTLSNSTPMYGCDTDGDGLYSFDLLLNDTAILNGQDPNLFEVVYFATPSDRDNDKPITTNFTNANPYSSQTVYAQVRNKLSATCYANTEFTINVIKQPLVNILPDLILCDDTASGSDTDGQAVFDLSVQNSVALGSQNPSQFAITYHLSQTDADAQTNPLSLTYTNLSTLQTIYVRMENVDHTDCYATSSFNLVVNPLPVLTAASVQLEQCDDDTDGFAAFNLTEANSLLSVNYLQETFTYYPTQNDALSQTHVIANPTAYVNPTVTTASVWTEVTNALGCSRIKEVTLQVVTTQIPIATLITLTQCDDFAVDNDDTNGITAFDLTQAQIQIAALFPNPQDLNITFYQNISDALAEQNEITDLQNYRNETAPFIQLLTVRVDNKYYNACVGLGEHVTLNVSSTPQFDIVNPGVVCLNESPVTLSATTDGKRYDYLWSDDQYNPLGIDPTLDITQGGTYHLTLTIQGSTGCDKTKSITVEESQESLLTTQDLDYSQFQYNNTLTIPTGTQYGIGDYQYALDPNGTFTAEPYFEGLTGGSYILYIEDLKGCRLHQVPFTILEYMRFFTPNADGYNDTWNLLGADLAPDAEIQIFDRYGKLLATVNPLGNGWDGTYNGQPMPSTDYWFTIKLSDGTTHKGHFSLIRK